MFSVVVHSCSIYEMDVLEHEGLFKGDDSREQRSAQRAVLVSLLIHLEDKKGLDEILSEAVHIVKEGFICFPKLPDPGKRIPDFPVVTRSRFHFQVWCWWRL